MFAAFRRLPYGRLKFINNFKSNSTVNQLKQKYIYVGRGYDGNTDVMYRRD